MARVTRRGLTKLRLAKRPAMCTVRTCARFKSSSKKESRRCASKIQVIGGRTWAGLVEAPRARTAPHICESRPHRLLLSSSSADHKSLLTNSTASFATTMLSRLALFTVVALTLVAAAYAYTPSTFTPLSHLNWAKQFNNTDYKREMLNPPAGPFGKIITPGGNGALKLCSPSY